jgi:oligopeptide/dipeptide ABC transporter ATP-binding protein
VSPAEAPLLELRGVTKRYGGGGLPGFRRRGMTALDGVSIAVRRGEVLGIVGESGSGKSTLASIAVGLVQPDEGEVLVGGRPLAALRGAELRKWRLSAQMVFQDSGGALNPRKSVRRVLREALAARGADAAELAEAPERLLDSVGLGAEFLPRLPHEMSGGQRQRVGIARALAVRPRLLLADEPVASLDVSLQAQVVNLLMRLTRELGLTLVFVSHDLALVRALAGRVAVMHRGRVVEEGPAAAVFAAPRHPYTALLLAAVPRGLAGRGRPPAAPAAEDNPHAEGCRFAPRCPRRSAACAARPPLAGPAGHLAACFHPLDAPISAGDRAAPRSSLSLGTAPA